jgi:large subunit ribosomal protein L6
MSRFGKLPIEVPAGVTVTVTEAGMSVTGPKGTLSRPLPQGISLTISEKEVVITGKNESKIVSQNQGTTRAHLINMIKGVTDGWKKQLEIVGAGYRAEVKGQDLVMQIGYSHPVVITAPTGLTFKVEKSIVTVEGSDKEAVGHVSSLVRASRPPEPYKGTGIKYTDEVIRRKAGKQAAK